MALKKARVLCGFSLKGKDYAPDQVVEADAAEIKKQGGNLDDSEEAVNYCIKTLKTKVIKI